MSIFFSTCPKENDASNSTSIGTCARFCTSDRYDLFGAACAIQDPCSLSTAETGPVSRFK